MYVENLASVLHAFSTDTDGGEKKLLALDFFKHSLFKGEQVVKLIL